MPRRRAPGQLPPLRRRGRPACARRLAAAQTMRRRFIVS